MKELTIIGTGGVVLSKTLVDVDGDNFVQDCTLPLFLPLVSISLLDVEKEKDKQIRDVIHEIKGMVMPKGEEDGI